MEGACTSGLPVPIAEPPVATLYQVTVPVAQVALKLTLVAGQMTVLSTFTAVGLAGVALTVIELEVRLELEQPTIEQPA